ncbi:MAG: class I SAM-dependent methyltransferase [Alphaproteobacteria bacterium]|nr:class I SAM-dependent methyltransferase [Alphaproteobacteria bacterium]
MPRSRTLSPTLRALFAQLVGGIAGLLTWRLTSAMTDYPVDSAWLPVALAGVSAALAGKFLLRLPNWWIPINTGFIPGIIGAMALNLPGWTYLIAFGLTLTVFWNVRSERVPLYLTNQTTWRTLSAVLPDKPGTRFIDLGSGLAGTLRYLARQHPDMTFTGVENAPAPLLISKIWQWIDPIHNLTITHDDMWKVDLSGFDVAYCFLSSAPMARLYEKAKTEMRPGSLLISNSFNVADHPPHEVCAVDDSRKTQLLIWRF